MLLLAHVSREEIPPALKKDLEFVLTKSMPLLQEMLAMSTLPRMQVGWVGWGLQVAPASGAVQRLEGCAAVFSLLLSCSLKQEQPGRAAAVVSASTRRHCCP